MTFDPTAVAWPDDPGLVPAVVQDHADGRVLMLAWVDREALAATLASGEVHFHSRSRDRLWRKGETKTISLTLGELPNQRQADATPAAPEANPSSTNLPRLGLSIAPAGQVAGSGSEGVVITNVDPDGSASDQGLKTGDVILEVGGKKVANPGDVRDAIGQAQKDGKRSVLVRLKSGEGSRFVAILIARA